MTSSEATLVLTGSIAQADIPVLCERARALLDDGRRGPALCDVSEVERPDVVTIAALARLQLTALRVGRRILLVHACAELRQLLDLTGLSLALPECPNSALESGRETEERE